MPPVLVFVSQDSERHHAGNDKLVLLDQPTPDVVEHHQRYSGLESRDLRQELEKENEQNNRQFMTAS